MFIWDFDLQTVLSVALLLPFSGAIFVLLLSYLQRHQQRADAQAALLEPLLAQAPIGFLLFDDRKKLLNCNSTARTLLLMPAESLALPNRHWATLLQQDLQTGGRYRTVEIAETQDSQDHPARVVRWWINHNELLTLVLLMDMTTELQAEQAASRLLSDLSHASPTSRGPDAGGGRCPSGPDHIRPRGVAAAHRWRLGSAPTGLSQLVGQCPQIWRTKKSRYRYHTEMYHKPRTTTHSLLHSR